MTISEIAKIANVSKTTVSRVLNNKPDVNPETRKKIMSIIAEHDFQPNSFAKAISLNKSNNIGLIIPYSAEYIFSNPFYVEVLRGVSTEVDKSGYYLLLCYPHDLNYMQIYKQKRADGFIIMSPGDLHRNILNELIEAEVPFVSTAKLQLPNRIMHHVDVDNKKGGILALNHLVELGHRKIAFVGKAKLTSSLDRLSGYKTVLSENNIEINDDYIHVAESSSLESGYEITRKLLNLDQRPTAAFYSSDIMAIGATKAAAEIGINIPDDFAIVGFNDIPMSSVLSPTLSTIHQPAFEKGVEATKMLILLLETGQAPMYKELDLELIIRESSQK